MKKPEEQNTLVFTAKGAWMGFVAYLILAAIIAAVFIVGY
jgi:hypothetical protein